MICRGAGLARPGVQYREKDNLLYLCVMRLPADRKLIVPDMTIPIANAYFLADPKKQPLNVVKADTGIQAVVVPEFSAEAFGQTPR